MSTDTITPVTGHDGAALTITAESAGGLSLRRGPGPLGTVLQKLADRCDHARDGLAAHLAWNGSLAVSGSAPNSISVEVGTIAGVTLFTAGGAAYVHAGGGITITQTKVEGGGNTLTAAAQWWYVYAFRDGSSLDYQISTTAPSAGLAFKTGGVLYRYLGCFRTLSTGVPIAVRACRGVYRYRRSAQAVADLRVLAASSSATSNTAIACASLVPPHARIAAVRAVVTCGDINYTEGYLRTNGDGGLDEVTVYAPPAVNASGSWCGDVETDASQQIAYRVMHSSVDMNASVDGFSE